MIAVIQRVNYGCVEIDSKTEEISKGYVVLVGVDKDDNESDVDWIANKILNLRIFPNEDGKFDRSIIDVNGEILVVSQFTLLGDCSKGRRPDFTRSAAPDVAEKLYENLINELKKSGLVVKSGVFGAKMLVKINNDGPITIIINSKK